MGVTKINAAFAASILERFLRGKEINHKGCFIPNKQPRPDGYVRFSVTKGNSRKAFGVEKGEQTYYLHQLAWYVAGNEVPNDSSVVHLSHLCLDPRCFNVEHIVLESPKKNNSRKNCGKIHTCPNCEHTFSDCAHEPKCIA